MLARSYSSVDVQVSRVIRKIGSLQFKYAVRYERDLNGSSRPPLRLITIRDASAESPMVLCISDIIWPAGGSEANSAPGQNHPELEVTDGWYRLRARIDAPLARSVRKGKIKIGRKIALAGAKVSSAILKDMVAPFSHCSFRRRERKALKSWKPTIPMFSC